MVSLVVEAVGLDLKGLDRRLAALGVKGQGEAHQQQRHQKHDGADQSEQVVDAAQVRARQAHQDAGRAEKVRGFAQGSAK